MFSISLFLHGCSKPQALVGSAVSQTQGVQCGTMLCLGLWFYFFPRHTRVIRDPIENTLLPLKAQARHEVTSERAPRHSAWPCSTPRGRTTASAALHLPAGPRDGALGGGGGPVAFAGSFCGSGVHPKPGAHLLCPECRLPSALRLPRC